ncbi:hypothetical protein EGY31_00470 [Burkholderia multivorans]|uniref:hypothetical protein n=1 Tax=Burkholderia ubonensis TaxID=101571 RepID=UPI000F71DC06|nr:hypothetical protein [Burkholderia ubonensis]AYZ61870.1 hypothetical protein EGY31_00470 [Burkholderia multivorans]VWB56416.1 hypothetical protein BUB20358_02591 [Burkholderia ubonensis]
MTISISSSTSSTPLYTQQTQAQPASSQDKSSVGTTTKASSVSVSWLAQQLSDAESRAQTRNSTLGRKELGARAETIVDQIAGESWAANRAKHDAELPKSDDPQALALAKQATDFSHGIGTNPFKGMSREQLDAIAYDDSGSFTVNERQAAWHEAYDQEQAWRVRVIAEGDLEYQRTGKQNDFFSEVLKHYKGLPAIEQAQYPDDYASKLQHWISLDFNFHTNQAEGSGTSHKSVVETLLAQGPHARNGAKIAASATQGTPAAH